MDGIKKFNCDLGSVTSPSTSKTETSGCTCTLRVLQGIIGSGSLVLGIVVLLSLLQDCRQDKHCHCWGQNAAIMCTLSQPTSEKPRTDQYVKSRSTSQQNISIGLEWVAVGRKAGVQVGTESRFSNTKASSDSRLPYCCNNKVCWSMEPVAVALGTMYTRPT